MKYIEEVYKIIDEKEWDYGQLALIESAFKGNFDKIPQVEQEKYRRYFQLEQEVFSFVKGPEKGLTSKISGTKNMEDGSEVSYQWPDINDWKQEDFDYIQERFNNCKNLFTKTEYGLVLYYSGHLNHNKEVIELLRALFDLSKLYVKKSISGDEIEQKPFKIEGKNVVKNFYILYFRHVLENAFHIANKRKKDSEFHELLKQLILFATDIHNKWDVTHNSTLRSIIDLTDFAIMYKKEFEKYVDLTKYLEQNYHAAQEISKTYDWGAIYICDISQKLATTLGNWNFDWQTLKAQQYESMVQPSIDSGNLAAITFVESALSIYKQINNKSKIEELSKKYDEVRRMFKLGEIKHELPEEENDRITKVIKKEVREKSPQELVQILCLAPMYGSLEQINKMASELYNGNTLRNLFPTSIIDKYGNTIEVYVDEEEKKIFNFWQAYGFNFQIGTQTLTHLFLESFKAEKINYDELIKFLSNSWLNKTYTELYNGHPFSICPMEVINPGLKSFFDELGKWIQEKEYAPNFVCSTDSLVTKSEYIIRFFCRLCGIPTFVDKVKVGHNLKMEKNIDELLRDLENTKENPTGFLEEHRKFIQYVLTQKAGSNLRHKVAHGLMDANEYIISNPLLLIVIILKLGTYTFK